MSYILFIDRAWPLLAKLVSDFEACTLGSDTKIILLSEFKPSGKIGRVEVINIHDIPQKRTLMEMQAEYQFSIQKTLVTERAFYDYCSFRRSQCYSRLTEQQIAEKITPYVNAIDYMIRERVDLVIDWIQDSFVPSIAGPIAKHYKKQFRMFLPHYWWSDGALILDRMDQTSSIIDRYYNYYYENQNLCNREYLDNIFTQKKTLYAIERSRMYSLQHRIALFRNRLKSYEPISLRHWIVRRLSKVVSSFLIKMFIARESEPGVNERFLVYPLQTSPEASLLGTYPEMADQFTLIKNVSMNLPYGVKLYVKEHPYEKTGAGLNFDFYRKLSVLPNVRIIRGSSGLSKLMNHPNFLAMVALNGTSIIEAAFLRKPVFIFGRSFYGLADCFIKPANYDEFYEALLTILQGNYKFNDGALYAMLMALDKSVVRADVDLVVDNSTDLLSQLPRIWASYIISSEWQIANTSEGLVSPAYFSP
jgi:hypothetical protein